jgi:hypothetical protein
MSDTKANTPERHVSQTSEGGNAFTAINKTAPQTVADAKIETEAKDSASPVPEDADTSPTTPAKKAPKPKKATTPKRPKEPKEPKTPKSKTIPAKRAADGETTPKSAKKMKGTTGDRKQIPTSMTEMKEEDKMLMKYKQVSCTLSLLSL